MINERRPRSTLVGSHKVSLLFMSFKRRKCDQYHQSSAAGTELPLPTCGLIDSSFIQLTLLANIFLLVQLSIRIQHIPVLNSRRLLIHLCPFRDFHLCPLLSWM